jgi:hypothetical protein
MSYGSQQAAERQDYSKAEKSGKCALGLNIAGIIMTVVIALIAGLTIYFTVLQAAKSVTSPITRVIDFVDKLIPN